jgi:hypothetical protein
VSTEDLLLLPGFRYYLDESDPDVVVLCRKDGGFVAAFNAREVTKEGSCWPRRKTTGLVLRQHAGRLAMHAEERLSTGHLVTRGVRERGDPRTSP